MTIDMLKLKVNARKVKGFVIAVALVNLVVTALVIYHAGGAVLWTVFNPAKVQREIMRIDRMVAADAIEDGRVVSPIPSPKE